ncbi:hypothetical protein RBU61_00910 [Tissierella sp. MB52-C2]|uniref:hypothetical protein n=1 Tax=Tissierella sp. MB52-C2 TaxID=3070999 RepID=UPI00280BE62A|nr:hypothetical protein [Tissierella sp. MB52-C2]WMM25251.1 hypothetical protein RBU61_00910 [Tissierella sp. MB52-C2]
MARQRKLTKERKNLIDNLLAAYKPEDAKIVGLERQNSRFLYLKRMLLYVIISL